MAAHCLLAWLCLIAPARAEPFARNTLFDRERAVDVVAAALAFAAPRTIEPISPARLSLIGLRGLAGLDARLLSDLRDGTVQVSLAAAQPEPQRLLFARLPPADDDVQAWAGLVGDAFRAAWDASHKVRRAGTDATIAAFLDEMCGRLDPYSHYATPDEADADRLAQSASAEIGAKLVQRGEAVRIGSLVPGGPGARAGLFRGDIVVSIDGEPTAGQPIEALQDALSGPENSAVVLEINRGGRVRTVEVSRAPVNPPTVQAEQRGSLLLLRVTDFADDTSAQMAHALASLSARHGIRGVVIDVRGNRGGLLREAAAAAETLLDRGVVAVTAGRDPASNHEFRAQGSDLAHALPVVVLVDGQSASAAEILAAALADQHRAVVVGSATYGKGLVQAVARLPNRGALFITWSRVLAPLGWPLQGLGLMPQLCTSRGADMIQAQLRSLASGHQATAEILTRHRAARAPLALAEMLDIRSACPAAEGREGDMVAARFLIDRPAAYAAALIGPPPP